MEYTDNGYYSIIRPKKGKEGGTSLFNLRLDDLSDDELGKKVDNVNDFKL
jgi:hypothetical protein